MVLVYTAVVMVAVSLNVTLGPAIRGLGPQPSSSPATALDLPDVPRLEILVAPLQRPYPGVLPNFIEKPAHELPRIMPSPELDEAVPPLAGPRKAAPPMELNRGN